MVEILPQFALFLFFPMLVRAKMSQNCKLCLVYSFAALKSSLAQRPLRFGGSSSLVRFENVDFLDD